MLTVKPFLRTFCVASALAVVCSFASAQEGASKEVTWASCVKEARSANPSLISARKSVEQAKAGRASAASARLPRIDLSARSSTSESNDSRSESHSYSASGSQLIFDGGKTRNRIAASDDSLSASRYSLEVRSSNVRLRLRSAFVALLRSQLLTGIVEGIAERRRQSFELVNLRYEAGREHRGSLLTSEANAAQAAFEVKQAARNLELTRVRLAKELGRGDSSGLTAAGELDIVEAEDEKPDLAAIADTHPLLRELASRKDAARHGHSAAKADYYPAVYASASTSRSDSKWPPEDDGWSAGISVSLPFFDGGSRRASVRKAAAATEQAAEDERSGRDQVITALTETWKDYRDALEQIGVRRKFLQAAEERARIAGVQYSNGLVSFDDWIIIENELVRARKSDLEARAGALIAEARWIQAKGGTLENE